MHKKRCAWVNLADGKSIQYHDDEWGVPVYDDSKLFEFIILESAQAGLSWQTILNKREGYRKAFYNFDVKKISKMKEVDVERLMQDSKIVRNRLKILATINNAKCFLAIQKEFGSFSNFIWKYVDGKPLVNSPKSVKEVPAVTPLAMAMSKELKKRGFKFLGPTIMYAYMQAVGMVNDHSTDCFRYKELIK